MPYPCPSSPHPLLTVPRHLVFIHPFLEDAGSQPDGRSRDRTIVGWRPIGLVTRIPPSHPSTVVLEATSSGLEYTVSFSGRNHHRRVVGLLRGQASCVRGLNLPSGRSQAQAWWDATVMPTSTISRGSSMFQHLNATKKVLQDVTIDVRYAWSGEMGRVRRLISEWQDRGHPR